MNHCPLLADTLYVDMFIMNIQPLDMKVLQIPCFKDTSLLRTPQHILIHTTITDDTLLFGLWTLWTQTSSYYGNLAVVYKLITDKSSDLLLQIPCCYKDTIFRPCITDTQLLLTSQYDSLILLLWTPTII